MIGILTVLIQAVYKASANDLEPVEVFSHSRYNNYSANGNFQSAEDWVSETPWVRILLSAEEDNLSPFDSKIACLCQSIEINNNKYVYRQSQVRMPNGSGVRWAECLLIIGTGCRVQVFSLILDSSVGLSAGIQSAEDWVSETPWVRILLSAEEDNLSPFDSKIACLCQSIEINNNKYICIYMWLTIELLRCIHMPCTWCPTEVLQNKNLRIWQV